MRSPPRVPKRSHHFRFTHLRRCSCRVSGLGLHILPAGSRFTCSSEKWDPSLFPPCRWRSWGLEWLKDLPKITPLGRFQSWHWSWVYTRCVRFEGQALETWTLVPGGYWPLVSDSNVIHCWKRYTLTAFYKNKLLVKWKNVVKARHMATHSSILAWEIPWADEPGRLQSMGSQRVRHDWTLCNSIV